MNDRQQRFVAAYRVNPNATQAAIKAGYAKGSAHVTGCRLLSDANVRAALAASRIAVLEQANMDSAWVLRRLAELDEVDILELFDDDGSLKALSEIPPRARRLIHSIETKRFLEPGPRGRPQAVEIQKVRLLDRLRVLEDIGKHVQVGAFKETTLKIGKLVIIRNFTGIEHEQPVTVIDAEAHREG